MTSALIRCKQEHKDDQQVNEQTSTLLGHDMTDTWAQGTLVLLMRTSDEPRQGLLSCNVEFGLLRISISHVNPANNLLRMLRSNKCVA